VCARAHFGLGPERCQQMARSRPRRLLVNKAGNQAQSLAALISKRAFPRRGPPPSWTPRRLSADALELCPGTPTVRWSVRNGLAANRALTVGSNFTSGCVVMLCAISDPHYRLPEGYHWMRNVAKSFGARAQ
jgi:hypothetical protein